VVALQKLSRRPGLLRNRACGVGTRNYRRSLPAQELPDAERG
jgi:hypothetical protein